MFARRTQAAILILSLVLFRSMSVWAEPPGERNSIAPEAIARWIEELDSDTYIVRERAMLNLANAGAAALDPVARAADGKNLEVATRAVRVLLEMSESENNEQAIAALERVAALKNRSAERRRAEATLRAIRDARAIAEIKRLGGILNEQTTYVLDSDAFVGRGIELGESWKGSDASLEYVKDVQNLDVLQIYTATVTDRGLARLQRLKGLKQIQLYGTGATAEGVASLRQALPNTDVQYRRGAFLGVRGGVEDEGGAVILEVTPKSAAERAGVEVGDVITKFNGHAVKNFQELTAMIAQHKPADKATLLIMRKDKPLTKEVTFGRWK